MKYVKTFENFNMINEEKTISANELNIDDEVKFIKKNDKNDIINAKIVNIIKDKKIEFINLDYPDVGICSYTLPTPYLTITKL